MAVNGARCRSSSASLYLTAPVPRLRDAAPAARAVAPTVPGGRRRADHAPAPEGGDRDARAWRCCELATFVRGSPSSRPIALERSLLREALGYLRPAAVPQVSRCAPERGRGRRRLLEHARSAPRAACSSLRADADAGAPRSGWSTTRSRTGRREMVAPTFPWVRLLALGRERRVRRGGEPRRGADRDARGSRPPTRTSRCEPGALRALRRCGRARSARRRGRRRGWCCPTARRSTRSTRFPTLPFTALFNVGLCRARRVRRPRCCLEGIWDPDRERDVDWAIGAFLLRAARGVGRRGRVRRSGSGCTPRTSTSAGALAPRRLAHALRAVGARAPRGQRGDHAGLGRRARGALAARRRTPGCCAAAAWPARGRRRGSTSPARSGGRRCSRARGGRTWAGPGCTALGWSCGRERRSSTTVDGV